MRRFVRTTVAQVAFGRWAEDDVCVSCTTTTTWSLPQQKRANILLRLRTILGQRRSIAVTVCALRRHSRMRVARFASIVITSVLRRHASLSRWSSKSDASMRELLTTSRCHTRRAHPSCSTPNKIRSNRSHFKLPSPPAHAKNDKNKNNQLKIH